MDNMDILNKIYEPICNQCKEMENLLKENGYVCKKGFYNNHSVKDGNGNWIIEYFPIPVVTVGEICDVGINLDLIFIETKMKREKAIKYDFSKLLKYKFEIYGIEEFLKDFYNDTLDIEGIPKRIEISNEKEIGIGFEIENQHMNEIIEIINELTKLETYI